MYIVVTIMCILFENRLQSNTFVRCHLSEGPVSCVIYCFAGDVCRFIVLDILYFT